MNDGWAQGGVNEMAKEGSSPGNLPVAPVVLVAPWVPEVLEGPRKKTSRVSTPQAPPQASHCPAQLQCQPMLLH